jgi:hypothetical protein
LIFYFPWLFLFLLGFLGLLLLFRFCWSSPHYGWVILILSVRWLKLTMLVNVNHWPPPLLGLMKLEDVMVACQYCTYCYWRFLNLHCCHCWNRSVLVLFSLFFRFEFSDMSSPQNLYIPLVPLSLYSIVVEFNCMYGEVPSSQALFWIRPPTVLLSVHNEFSHSVYTKGHLGQVFKLMPNTLSLGSMVMLKNLIELLETSRSVVQKYLKR